MSVRLVSQNDRSAGQPFEASHSTIKTWRRCEQKYDYQYVQLLEKKKPVIQLIRGTMIGKCLDLLAAARGSKKPINWRTALKPFEKDYAKLFKAEKDYYGDPIGEVTRIITKYEEIYAKDGLTYRPGPDGNPYELPVRVDLAPGIVYTGHIDKMPVDKQGRVWNMDHKSHKKIPDPDARFSDLQQLFYMWAMPLSGYPKPTGVIWDYLRTKAPTVPETLKKGGLSQRQDIDTDYDTYLAEVQRLKLKEKDYPILKTLKARGNMDFYQRVSLPMPGKKLIENVVADAQSSAVEMKRRGGVKPVRSMDRMCKSCNFYNLCQAEFRGLDSSFIRKNEYQIQKDPRHIHLVQDEE